MLPRFHVRHTLTTSIASAKISPDVLRPDVLPMPSPYANLVGL